MGFTPKPAAVCHCVFMLCTILVLYIQLDKINVIFFYIKDHFKLDQLLLLHCVKSVVQHKTSQPHHILFNVYFKFE